MLHLLQFISAACITAVGVAGFYYSLLIAPDVDAWMIFAAIGALASGLALLFVVSGQDGWA